MRRVSRSSANRYKDLYQVLLNAIPSSVLLISRSFRIVSANRNFLEKSKRSEADTLNRKLPEVFPPPLLDNLDLVRRIQMAFQQNQQTLGERMIYRAPGGLMRIYYYRVLPLAWNGSVDRVMLLMDDVTEQTRLSEDIRRTERHLAIVVESASEFLLSTDPDGRILSWNKSAEQVSGYALQEVHRHKFSQLCIPEHQADVDRVFAQLTQQKIPQTAEWNLVTKAGNTITISWTCAPMLDDDSRIIGVVAAGRDLTESRKLEAQLLQAQKLAALGVMAGGIAHEIRNPLAICSSAAQFLMENEITPEFRIECARKINTAIQRSAAIIENLLKFARPSVSRDPTRLDLVALLQDTILLIANQANVSNITLRCYLPEEPVFVSGVASPLQQVFMNLFLNAITAMPRGGLLGLTMEKTPAEVLVHVSDTGQGIGKDDIDQIFNPFFTKWENGKGIGLGLSLCYFITKQHSGSIQVESVEEKGSTFTVRLPLAPALPVLGNLLPRANS